MTEAFQPGDSVEGDKLKGHSREDLKPRGTTFFHGKRCLRYTAKRDVTVIVTKTLSVAPFNEEPNPKTVQDPTSLTEVDDSIKCDKVIIHTRARKVSNDGVGPESHTHNAQRWSFNDHSHALIDYPHAELVSALENRNLSLVQPSKGKIISILESPVHALFNKH